MHTSNTDHDETLKKQIEQALKDTHCWVTDECGNNAAKAIQAHIDKRVNEVLDRVEAEAGWYSQQFNDQARKDNIEDTLIRLSSIKKLRSEL